MKKDNIVADGKWVFDSAVTNCFDDMLARSIPDYTTMRDLTLRVADNFIGNNRIFNMIDLGCSNGINLDLFISKYGDKGKYTGIDNSAEMISKAIEKLEKYNVDKKLINCNIVDFEFADYAVYYDIITSILTLQFVPIEYRPLILHRIFNILPNKGVFILVEKILQPDQIFNDLYVKSYYDIKRNNGYTDEQIYAKKKSLEGVLVPNTHSGNIELLKTAGFKYVDTFWKCLNFEGYVAVKE